VMPDPLTGTPIIIPVPSASASARVDGAIPARP
jgi:iron complex transport system ATP-binding protein